MGIPASYGDLGKAANDLFKKGYGYGVIKCDVKSTSGSGLEFNIAGTKDANKIDGSLETKFKCSESGVSITKKLTTDANLNLEIGVDSPVEGAKVTLCTAFAPNTGKINGAVKTSYKRDHFNGTLDSDLNLSGPLIQGSAVFGYEGLSFGHQFAFDSSKSALTKNNVALGYATADIQSVITCNGIPPVGNDQTNFGGSLFQKVNADLSLGVQLGWTKGDSSASFGVATKYQIDGDSSCVAKVNNSGHIGCGYSHQLKPGVKLTLSSLIDSKNFADGGHKVGLGLEFSV